MSFPSVGQPQIRARPPPPQAATTTDTEKEKIHQLEIVILQLMIQFLHEKGYTPEPHSPELHAFIKANGFKLNEPVFTDNVDTIKFMYLGMKRKRDLEGSAFKFLDSSTERIFHLAAKLWDEELKFSQDAVQHSFLLNPDSGAYSEKTTEIKKNVWATLMIKDAENTAFVQGDTSGYNIQKSLEIEVLIGLHSFYHNAGGVVPQPHSGELYKFLQETVLVDFEMKYPRPYIAALIWKLYYEFRRMNKAEERYVPFSNPQDGKIYELSKKIWGSPAPAHQLIDLNEPPPVDDELDKFGEEIEDDVIKSILLLTYCYDDWKLIPFWWLSS
ncbi:OLC1v1003277C1 [Oldenlandia corymbosa var. corymbosa]|uniref:OLC1v1003277C1 n=1 Tax=Oldenlandia corymbosa var. corymbosa TaxID=529605 RepID=A0AAV1D9N8_OLDCO|nr:OLC1v1003277C1 [Oldenlandia corymbosa var. corymbosa]